MTNYTSLPANLPGVLLQKANKILHSGYSEITDTQLFAIPQCFNNDLTNWKSCMCQNKPVCYLGRAKVDIYPDKHMDQPFNYNLIIQSNTDYSFAAFTLINQGVHLCFIFKKPTLTG